MKVATIDPPTEFTAIVAVVDEQLRRQVTEALAKTPVRLLDDSFSSGNVEELAAAVERLRPGILLLGLAGLRLDGVPSDPSVVMSSLTKRDFAPRVIAVSASAEPEIILKAMRAGAAEFLYSPFEPGFETALLSVAGASRTQTETSPPGKVIGFSSVKGGCGATTLACHGASWLQNSAKKEVLLADLDSEAGIVDTLMQSGARYTLDDALNNMHRLDLKLWKAVVATSPSGVDVIPPPPEPPTVAPISRKLPPIIRFWRMHYEYTMIDLGRGLSSTLLDVLSSIDMLVLVTTPEIPALRRAKLMIQSLAAREFGANRVKLVINRMPKHAAIGFPELEKIMGMPIHSTLPDDPQPLNDAYSYPRLVDLESSIGSKFSAFTAKVTGLTAAPGKARKLFSFR